MKAFVSISLLFLSLVLPAQEPQVSMLANSTPNRNQDYGLSTDDDDNELDHLAFKETAKRYGIAQKQADYLAIPNGYYAIAGVFAKDNKIKKLVKNYTRKGFNAGHFKDSKSGLNHVYLNKYNYWQNALNDIKSKFNDTYNDPVWVLHASNKDSKTKVLAKETNNDIITGKTKNAKKKSPKSRLIEKADALFDKMWYAEAAELYELALSKNDNNYSYETIQKAGDSYYFNTNMKKAYEWYTILYEKYGDQMSADNIFKYAHSLKGTGKYGRSKRLMRLYDKKLKEEATQTNTISEQEREAILDELLKSEIQFEVKNLQVNSKYSEFSPMYLNKDEVVFASAKDSSVFNTRRYKWDNQPYLDLYVSKLNEETAELKDAVKFSKQINTKYHEAAVTFTPDGKTMYFTRNNYGKKLRRDKNGINHLKIYRSKKVDGDWEEATEIPFNSDDYSTGHPVLSKDGKKMYFVSDMPGTMGATDIFVVDVDEDGNFGSPRNLGPEINTEQKEMFPFITNDKLYFSSDGHPGLGGLDVFEATLNDEGGFSNTINLGKPINSNKDDFSYIIDRENERGYFASNRDGGKGRDDLYAFNKIMPEEQNINAIAGIVVDAVSGEVLPNAFVELLDENNIKLKDVMTDDEGSFIFEELDSETRYVLKTKKETYLQDERMVATTKNDTINVEIALNKLEKMIAVEDGIRKIKTEAIHFDFDKAYIRNDAAEELDKLVEVMNEYPQMVIKIESHTDSRGSDVYNQYLSDKRAKSTRDYIISMGIAPDRIQSATGYGESRLLNECDGTVRCTEQKHFLNRRSEFIIVNM